MMRTLDLTALRALVAVADSGGVTRAANLLNLTQSAVSMQMKRLEQAVGLPLLERAGRHVILTSAGEQLLGYARRMIALNDEAVTRLTEPSFEGELVLGVPHDIVYPHIPSVLKRFSAEFPRVKVNLLSSYTTALKAQFEEGSCDIILATEDTRPEGAEVLATLPLVWVGAPGGTAWRARPLRLAFERNCMFRPLSQAALDRVDIPWELAVESDSSRSIAATVSADLAVHVAIAGTTDVHFEEICHGDTLPDLSSTHINLYVRDLPDVKRAPGQERMAEMIRGAYLSRPLQRSAAPGQSVTAAALAS
ncbi:MAG: LysR family transcriptional regulator [Rhodobacteraceae bacterium]|nr:LysR family transcriptional regulator [Paracoccaceae bacterium]